MDLKLTPRLERMVQQKVRGGGYASASEVVQEAWRFFEERDSLAVFRRQDLSKQIEEGLASLRRHGSRDGGAVFARLDAKLKALQKRRAA
jgi:putative addiction module CopG family antidote